MSSKEPMLMCLARSGGENFAFNNLLEFLNLKETVHLLILLRKGDPSFVPTPAVLQELVDLSLHQRQQEDSDMHPSITFRPMETMPTLSYGVNSTEGVDKKLTIRTLRCLYDLARHIECEYQQPSINVEVRDGKLCMISSPVDIWQATIGFPCSPCSNDECNQIVLWDCSLCKNVCTDCMACATVCFECEERVCNGCFLAQGDLTLCKNCSFVCVGCGEFCLDADEGRFECGGTPRGVKCTRRPGPHCRECAMSRMILKCPMCEKVSCFDCNPVSFCAKCSAFSCMNCFGMNFCDKCCNFYCRACSIPFMCMKCYKFRCDDCRSDLMWCDECHQMFCMGCNPVGVCSSRGCMAMKCVECDPLLFIRNKCSRCL